MGSLLDAANQEASAKPKLSSEEQERERVRKIEGERLSNIWKNSAGTPKATPPSEIRSPYAAPNLRATQTELAPETTPKSTGLQKPKPLSGGGSTG